MAAGRPHILILMTDQQRADCLSCAGHPIVRTPNMDRLAKEGMRFARAYTTSPICLPARSSFLSGLFCHNHGQWENVGHLPPNADTYLRHLKRAGYHTAHVGKSHLYHHEAGHHLNEARPFMRRLGWDDVLETTGPIDTMYTDSIMTDHWREAGCLDTFRNDYRRRREVGDTAATWPSPMPRGETLDDFIGRTAVEYVRGYDRAQPLLLFVGFGAPHPPWDPPADWAAKYDPAQMDAPQPVSDPGPWVPPAAATHQRKLENHSLGITPEINGRIRSLYYAKISHADWWFGQILGAFEERGLLEDTAVIFWSDHGEMLCDKGRLHKGVFYEQTARVPLIVRPARARRRGQVSHSLVSLVDLFPTILELAGCDPRPGCFGRSLLGLFAQPDLALHDAVFGEIHERTMIRDERYKMVIDSSGAVLKLYDLLEDPHETLNLAGHPQAGEVTARLQHRLLRWHLATQRRQTLESDPSPLLAAE